MFRTGEKAAEVAPTHLGVPFTLPKTNVAPKNGGFPIGISFSRGLFSRAMLVSGREVFVFFSL